MMYKKFLVLFTIPLSVLTTDMSNFSTANQKTSKSTTNQTLLKTNNHLQSRKIIYKSVLNKQNANKNYKIWNAKRLEELHKNVRINLKSSNSYTYSIVYKSWIGEKGGSFSLDTKKQVVGRHSKTISIYTSFFQIDDFTMHVGLVKQKDSKLILDNENLLKKITTNNFESNENPSFNLNAGGAITAPKSILDYINPHKQDSNNEVGKFSIESSTTWWDRNSYIINFLITIAFIAFMTLGVFPMSLIVFRECSAPTPQYLTPPEAETSPNYAIKSKVGRSRFFRKPLEQQGSSTEGSERLGASMFRRNPTTDILPNFKTISEHQPTEIPKNAENSLVENKRAGKNKSIKTDNGKKDSSIQLISPVASDEVFPAKSNPKSESASYENTTSEETSPSQLWLAKHEVDDIFEARKNKTAKQFIKSNDSETNVRRAEERRIQEDFDSEVFQKNIGDLISAEDVFHDPLDSPSSKTDHLLINNAEPRPIILRENSFDPDIPESIITRGKAFASNYPELLTLHRADADFAKIYDQEINSKIIDISRKFPSMSKEEARRCVLGYYEKYEIRSVNVNKKGEAIILQRYMIMKSGYALKFEGLVNEYKLVYEYRKVLDKGPAQRRYDEMLSYYESEINRIMRRQNLYHYIK